MVARRINKKEIENLLEKFQKFSDKIDLTRMQATQLSCYVLANCLWHHPELESAKKQAFALIEQIIDFKLLEDSKDG